MIYARTYGHLILAVLMVSAHLAEAQPVGNELSDLARFRSY